MFHFHIQQKTTAKPLSQMCIWWIHKRSAER